MRYRIHQASVLALILTASPLFANPASAMPRFSTMEFEMPADPLLASSDPMWKQHTTGQSRLAPMLADMHAAIPDGTSQGTAMARLQQAGARCHAVSADQMACGYHTVETRDEYVDDVHWTVDVGLHDGAVDRLSVERNWTRH
jgi:hypothetical protein